jgi:hypothetical protein
MGRKMKMTFGTWQSNARMIDKECKTQCSTCTFASLNYNLSENISIFTYFLLCILQATVGYIASIFPLLLVSC